MHRLVAAILSGESDADMLEFWLRYIHSLGLEQDPMSYKIQGYQINWGRILNVSATLPHFYLITLPLANHSSNDSLLIYEQFNGAVTSVYFYTVYQIV